MIQAKKTLGQNFLKNKDVLKKIVEAGKLEKDEIVLEIGPGKGALTAEILKNGNRVIAVEKDSRLIPILKEKFSDEISKKQFVLFEGDALEIDYEKLNLVNHQFSIIANLPYYITGKFLSSSLSSDIQPKKIVLLLQKEIVERITGEQKEKGKTKLINKESILSISVKVYGDPKFITTVSRKNFNPEPAVDSAVLGIYDISKDFFLSNKIKEKDFFNFVKQAFSSKRKKIIKNISSIYSKDVLLNVFQKLDLSIDLRAEDMNVIQLKDLFLELNKK